MTTAKTSARKAPLIKKGAPRASRAKPKAQQLTQPLPTLPAGFVVEGFEIVGDQVRIYGKVKGDIAGAGHATLSAGSLGRAIEAGAERYTPEPQAVYVEREPSVLAGSIDSIGHRITEVMCALDNLTQSIGMVLLPVPASPAGGDATANEVQMKAPAIEELHRHANRLESLTNSINCIAARVQA